MNTLGFRFGRQRASLSSLSLALTVALAVMSCDSSSSGGSGASTSGTVTLGIDDGVAFESGTVVPGDKFNQVDLVATAAGDNLRLAAGGATTTNPNPVNWFFGSSGMVQTFASLADVPNEKPDDSSTQSLMNTEAGVGFVVKNYVSGGYTKGWVRSANSTQVVIEYEIIE